ncbi:MAG TPA: histidine ammonia-lyase [Steroidobacteraceae bacterium]|nr:histidine ammonia-lyase [Steroidobacteraceae bacterium]
MNHWQLTGRNVTLEMLAQFERSRPRVSLSADALERVTASHDAVAAAVAAGRVSYGITTGFGAFANRQIPAHKVKELQLNLVRSHSCGVGEPLAPHLVRRILLLKANNLAAGHSGVRPVVIETLLALLNHDVLPVIPARGSVGASGDLAPLAHLALALIGEGEAQQGERRLSNRQVLEAARVTPLELEAKEGLALLNGTQLSTALAVEGTLGAQNLLDASISVGALTVDALAGSYTPFDARIHAARGLRGQIDVGERFRRLLTDSDINRSHENCDRVQDPYAVRCMPQVLGAVADTIEHARVVLGGECNGVSDNPLIFGEDILSGGNFHGAPLGFVSDFLGIAVAELASMSERRTDLLDRRVNPNLNMFLTSEPGVESGFMIAHVTAAALASENKTLAHPASVDSIPTSAGQEDHVSMAPWAGHKLLRICENTVQVLAIELLGAAHAIDSMRPLRSTPLLEQLHALVRARVPFNPKDHRLDRDIAQLADLVRSGAVAEFVRVPAPSA